MNFCGRFLFGKGAIEKIGSLCEEIGLSGKALLVNDEITWEIAGKKISESLLKSGFEEVENTTIEKGAVMSEVDKVRERIRLIRPSAVFGIGGGVNIDVVKVAASEEGVDYITIPTIFATDAMSTTVSVIYNSHSEGFLVKPMLAVVVDTDIIAEAPWRFQAAGFADYLSKICGIHDWKLSYSLGKDPIYSEYATTVARAKCEWLIENASSIRRKEENAFNAFLKILMADGFLMEMAGNMRILFGSEHMVALALDDEFKQGKRKPLHGETISIATILMSCLQGEDWKSIKKALRAVDAPVTADQIGLDREAVIRALTKSRDISLETSPDLYSILLEKPLTKKTATELAEKTGVIQQLTI
jgi:glycerol-1-phosphate dehydrogenase [NAD(P)+]